MTLTILQDNTRIELVSVGVIEALYNLAKSGNVMYLTGRLESNAAYSDAVLYLNSNFSDLTVTVQDLNNLYYRFLDDVCRLIIALYFNLQHIPAVNIENKFESSKLSENMSFLRSAFKDNTSLHIIDLRPFDFYHMMPNENYYGTNKLDITRWLIGNSENVTDVYIGKFPIFTNEAKVVEEGLSGDVTLNKFACYKCKEFQGGTTGIFTVNILAFFNISIFGGYAFRNTRVTDLYIGNTTPPTITFGTNSSWSRITGNIYVPIGSKNTYTSDGSFSLVASKIQEYDFDTDPDNIFGGMSFTL